MIKKLCLAFTILFIANTTKAQDSDVIQNYINTYCGIAIEEMQRTGVPAAIKLAQGIHETMAGQSELVKKSNNHFGIKCKEGYTGPYVLHDDDRPKERFMKYEDAMQSYRDHSDFLKNRTRYASLFQLDPTDYESWAKGLKKAGYATNPKYPQLLIKLIEKYNLEEYSLMALGKTPMNEKAKNYFDGSSFKSLVPATPIVPIKPKITYPESDFLINNTKVIFASAGSSLSEIASKYNLALNKLNDYNDFQNPSDALANGSLVFLQLKRTIGSKPFHEVQEGETIYDIAQVEGIRLESLLKYNNLSKFDSLIVGTKLKLQEPSLAIN